MLKLNLGCGTDYQPGWVNVDRGNVPCDVQHDIEVFPFPWEDNSVGVVLLKHTLEHIHPAYLPALITEIRRICAPGATLLVEAPYAMSDNFFTDPTHRFPVTTRTLDYFDPSKPLGQNGAIYGWPMCLSVELAMLRDNPPFGPDVVIQARITK